MSNKVILLSAFETDEFYEKIDLIVCNPPYILSSKVQKMDAEIASNEPVLAFDGGMLGIKIIQKLISEAPKFLIRNGWLAFEVGARTGRVSFKALRKIKVLSEYPIGIRLSWQYQGYCCSKIKLNTCHRLNWQGTWLPYNIYHSFYISFLLGFDHIIVRGGRKRITIPGPVPIVFITS